jgi:hypothetical protein
MRSCKLFMWAGLEAQFSWPQPSKKLRLQAHATGPSYCLIWGSHELPSLADLKLWSSHSQPLKKLRLQAWATGTQLRLSFLRCEDHIWFTRSILIQLLLLVMNLPKTWGVIVKTIILTLIWLSRLTAYLLMSAYVESVMWLHQLVSGTGVSWGLEWDAGGLDLLPSPHSHRPFFFMASLHQGSQIIYTVAQSSPKSKHGSCQD